MTDANGLAYGFTSVSEDGVLQEGILDYKATSIADDKKDDVKQYIWKVTVTENLGAYSYKFENVATGKTLRVNTTAGSEAVELNSAASGNVIKDVFAFGATQIGTTGKYTASEKAPVSYTHLWRNLAYDTLLVVRSYFGDRGLVFYCLILNAERVFVYSRAVRILYSCAFGFLI